MTSIKSPVALACITLAESANSTRAAGTGAVTSKDGGKQLYDQQAHSVTKAPR